jgi:phosphoglycolate phosphatase
MTALARIVITDLDNTLWDWHEIYVRAYMKMFDSLVQYTKEKKLQLDKDLLFKQIRAVHLEHKDSEYPLSILHTQVIKDLFKTNELNKLKKICKEPFLKSFEQAHHAGLEASLYGNIHETLLKIQESGIKIVAYTDAKIYAVLRRLGHYKLFDVFDMIVCRKLHDNLQGPAERYYRSMIHNAGGHNYLDGKILQIDGGFCKPRPETLGYIIEELQKKYKNLSNLHPREIVYVGDSLRRDIFMVNTFNQKNAYNHPHDRMTAIYAEYGVVEYAHSDHTEMYEFLRKISFWDPKDEEDEIAKQKAEAQSPIADYTLKSSFEQILEVPAIKAALGVDLPYSA